MDDYSHGDVGPAIGVFKGVYGIDFSSDIEGGVTLPGQEGNQRRNHAYPTRDTVDKLLIYYCFPASDEPIAGLLGSGSSNGSA